MVSIPDLKLDKSCLKSAPVLDNFSFMSYNMNNADINVKSSVHNVMLMKTVELTRNSWVVLSTAQKKKKKESKKKKLGIISTKCISQMSDFTSAD